MIREGISWGMQPDGRALPVSPRYACDVSGHRGRPDPRFRGSGRFLWGGAGLVVLAGVDGELSEEFSGDGVDDADV